MSSWVLKQQKGHLIGYKPSVGKKEAATPHFPKEASKMFSLELISSLGLIFPAQFSPSQRYVPIPAALLLPVRRMCQDPYSGAALGCSELLIQCV